MSTGVKPMTLQIIILTIILSISLNNDAIEIFDSNADEMIQKFKYVFLDFYVNWCKYCVRMAPEFEIAAKHINTQYDGVRLLRINCEENPTVCGAHNVKRYPTLTVFRFGKPVKEYNEGRTAEAFIAFVTKDMNIDPVVITSADEMDHSKDGVLGMFTDVNSPSYLSFKKTVETFYDDCPSYVIFNPKQSVPYMIRFHPSQDVGKFVTFSGSLVNDEFSQWLTAQCRPFIREISFKNAESVTKDGVPLLIFIYSKDNSSAKETFKKVVEQHVELLRDKLHPVYACGEEFNLVLRRLRISLSDLPHIVIDNYQHMYSFINISQLETHEFVQFLEDFLSDKLHRDLHSRQEKMMAEELMKMFGNLDIINGVEINKPRHKDHAKLAPKQPSAVDIRGKKDAVAGIGGVGGDVGAADKVEESSKISSVFKNLAPNKDRYTFSRDIDDL